MYQKRYLKHKFDVLNTNNQWHSNYKGGLFSKFLFSVSHLIRMNYLFCVVTEITEQSQHRLRSSWPCGYVSPTSATITSASRLNKGMINLAE